MCCKNVLRHFQNYLAGWLESDVIKGMDDNSWHSAQLEGSATYSAQYVIFELAKSQKHIVRNARG